MTSKTNGDERPNGCSMILIAFTLITIILGLIVIGNYLSTLAGIH